MAVALLKAKCRSALGGHRINCPYIRTIPSVSTEHWAAKPWLATLRIRDQNVKKTKKFSNLHASAAPLVLGLALISAPAFAQTAPAENTAPADEEATSAEAIVVTGSRIARTNLELSSPVNVIGAEEIQFRQPTSIEDVLRQLPGSVPGIGSAVNNGSNGTATFNLRGLGSNRNLVLINSRRVVPSGTGGVVDLNLLPVALLERSEVLTGGASSVYGADAIDRKSVV